MVAELPTGAQAGLGAKLLTGSYYGNTIGIWSALVMSALLGLALVAAVSVSESDWSLRHAEVRMTTAAARQARDPRGAPGALVAVFSLAVLVLAAGLSR